MATDDLIDEGGEGTGDTKQDASKSNPTQVSPADISKAVKDGLAEFGGDMRQFSTQMGQYVQQAIQSATQATAKGTASEEQTDLTQRLLTDPEKAIGGVVQKMLSDQLGPYLRTKVRDDYEDHIESHRNRIDSQYGEGTFDELILDDLNNVVESADNKALRADKSYVATVVRGIVGHEKVLPKLMDKRTAKAEADKKAAAEAPTGILDGGRRRNFKPTLSAEDINFLNRYEDSTGKTTNRKILEEAVAVRARDGAWTIDNFPGLKKD